MAYEDPYFGPDTDVADEDRELPPEAAGGPSKIGLTIGIIAALLVIGGLVVGLLVGRSGSDD